MMKNIVSSLQTMQVRKYVYLQHIPGMKSSSELIIHVTTASITIMEKVRTISWGSVSPSPTKKDRNAILSISTVS